MKRILIVDAAATMRTYHRDLLERAGYGVDEAGNGIEALGKAISHPFDLYVVDRNMPEVDGLSFLRSLREADIERAPVIMVSTRASAADVAAAFAAGADDFLLKPADPLWFVPRVQLLLGVRRS